MKVVDLHPEELFDKEEAGTLSETERARLDAHVARCEACRLERRLRADFAAELGDEAEESQFPSNYLVAIVAGAQRTEDASEPAPAPAPAPEPEPEPELAPPVPLRRSGSLRRARWVVLLAAAAVAVVSVAAASETSGGRWIRRVVGVEATENEAETPAGGVPTKVAPLAVAPIVTATALAKPVASETEPAPPAEEIAAPSPVPVAEAPRAVAHAAPAAPAVTAAPKASAADTRWAPAEPEGASALLEETTLARRRGDYARAVTLARRLQSSFPESREAHVSQAALGRLLLDTGDPAGALASFEAYLSRRGGQLDEAVMVGRAISLDRLGRDAEARAAWSALLEAFPASPYAEHARTRGR